MYLWVLWCIFFLCSCAEVRQQATQGHALAHDPEAEVSMAADSSLCLYQGVILECLLPLFLPFCVHTPMCPLAVTLCRLPQLLWDYVHLPTHAQLLEMRTGGSLSEVFLSFAHLSYSHGRSPDLHSHTGIQKCDEARVESSVGILATEKSRRRGEGREEGCQESICGSNTGFVQCSLEMSDFFMSHTLCSYHVFGPVEGTGHSRE